MSLPERPIWPPPIPDGLTVRDARPEDSDALIAVELASPLVLGTEHAAFDRTPDFFSRHRLQGDHRICVALQGGEIVGVTAAAIHSPLINGKPHRLTYISHSRVRADARRRGVAGALAAALITWGRERGAEGPYWFIAPANENSIAFGGRGGGRWPIDATFRIFDVSQAYAPLAAGVEPTLVPEAVDLVNATHQGEDMFEPLSSASVVERLSNDPARYGPAHLRGVVTGGKLVAVAGFWDEGACLEEIRVNSSTGETVRSRRAAVLDWGWLPGEDDAFRRLLRALAAEARSLGRTELMLSEPSPGVLPDPALPSHAWRLSLFTPTIAPPPLEAIQGLFVDLVYL